MMPMHRRTFARLALPALLLAGATLAGCGFALRQHTALPFRTITLSGFAVDSPLAIELAHALEANGVDVVETTAQALASKVSPPAQAGASPLSTTNEALSQHLIFDALSDTRQQIVASSTAFGQVRDLTLRTRLRYQLLRADGSVLLPPTELLLSRDVTYNEKDALSKQSEIEALHKAMQSDIVSQVLRRLSVLNTASPR
jgi:LPS-assembly lipoprotein